MGLPVDGAVVTVVMVVPYGTSGGEMAQHGQGCPDPDVIEETTTTAPGKRFSVPTAMGNR